MKKVYLVKCQEKREFGEPEAPEIVMGVFADLDDACAYVDAQKDRDYIEYWWADYTLYPMKKGKKYWKNLLTLKGFRDKIKQKLRERKYNHG